MLSDLQNAVLKNVTMHFKVTVKVGKVLFLFLFFFKYHSVTWSRPVLIFLAYLVLCDFSDLWFSAETPKCFQFWVNWGVGSDFP